MTDVSLPASLSGAATEFYRGILDTGHAAGAGLVELLGKVCLLAFVNLEEAPALRGGDARDLHRALARFCAAYRVRLS
ncbi:hypothetical protein [Streptomyces sp. YKOK-I1]